MAGSAAASSVPTAELTGLESAVGLEQDDVDVLPGGADGDPAEAV